MKTQTYTGDRRNYDPDSFIGGNNRFFRPVAAEYDGRRTVITYEPVPMEEMQTRYGHLIDQAQDRAHLMALFGGRW